jgi:hypothetical protein
MQLYNQTANPVDPVTMIEDFLLGALHVHFSDVV